MKNYEELGLRHAEHYRYREKMFPLVFNPLEHHVDNLIIYYKIKLIIA